MDFLSGADFDAVFDQIEDDLSQQDNIIDLELDEDAVEVYCSFVLSFITRTGPKTDLALLLELDHNRCSLCEFLFQVPTIINRYG